MTTLTDYLRSAIGTRAYGQHIVKPFAAPWRMAALFLVWLGLFGIANFTLERTGAFKAEFDGNPDEASHMMTGMLIRDYLVSGTPLPAVKYAERQYLAYPKFAWGVWPPLFHVLEGGWFLFFEPTRGSAIVLMAALLSLSAVLSFVALRDEIGNKAACMIALFMVICPVAVSQFGVVIADALLVPLTLAATWYFARFLETHALRHSVWFGVFSALAFLTKYNGFLLVFVPILGIGLTRQWRLWLNPRLWAAPALILLLAGPWYLGHAPMIVYAADMGPGGFDSRTFASLTNLKGLMSFMGPLGSLLVGIGLCSRLVFAKPPSANSAAQAGLLFGVWAMHSLLYPSSTLRYLLPALPALLYFFCAGLGPATRVLQRALPRYAMRLLALASFMLMLVARPHEKPPRGWRDLTSRMRDLAGSRVLMICGEGPAEGALITEMAIQDRQRDRKPEWTVLRGSKMLAKSTWMGGNYRVMFNSPDEMLRSLKNWGVSVVAMDLTAKLYPHERMLLSALQQRGTWREEQTPMEGIRIFVDTKPPQAPREPIEVDMTYTLGRTLRLEPAESKAE